MALEENFHLAFEECECEIRNIHSTVYPLESETPKGLNFQPMTSTGTLSIRMMNSTTGVATGSLHTRSATAGKTSDSRSNDMICPACNT